MATENPSLIDSSCVAAADLRGKEGYAVKITAAKTVNLAGNGERFDGIIVTGANTGGAVTIQRGGKAKVVTGAAVAAGALLMPNASGKLITATTGLHIGAKALQASSADLEVVEAYLGYLGVV